MTYGEPLAHSITEGFERNARILDKVWHNVFAQPSAVRVLEDQRRVPMVQRDRRLDAILDAGVDEVVIMVNGLLVDWSTAKRQDS